MTTTFEDAKDLIGGTFQVGMVLASFEQLVAAFGSPHEQGPNLDRITAEWRIRTRAGILTIYDRSSWPAGYDTPPTEPVWWNLGGHGSEHTDCALHPVVALVGQLTGCHVQDARPSRYRPDGRPPQLGGSI